ncbi:N-6 DNA methylase [Aggregatibacter actinomycetemcomitans]|uniref:N-6 DNA methylase n=1 Tax=Aggregatibacter actinomycetemcomitans TaxID=714 RepID=UPI001F1BA092|nr:N-6 DNA methylase [Aggregatibacter actinomycetemcomitans]
MFQTHNENSRVKIPAVLHLMRLGYRYLSLKTATWDRQTNIFPDIFTESLCRINAGLIDASGLGEKIKDGKNQKTVLSREEEQKICQTFTDKQVVENFSVVVGYDEIQAKNYSLSAGQYFEVKIDYVDISADEFEQKMAGFSADLDRLFAESAELGREIGERLRVLRLGGK